MAYHLTSSEIWTEISHTFFHENAFENAACKMSYNLIQACVE